MAEPERLESYEATVERLVLCDTPVFDPNKVFWDVTGCGARLPDDSFHLSIRDGDREFRWRLNAFSARMLAAAVEFYSMPFHPCGSDGIASGAEAKPNLES